MPRFGLHGSPPHVERDHNDNPPNAASSLSKLLSCLSPDGRSVHLLHNDCIETHGLPLAGSSEFAGQVPIIMTKLPPAVLLTTEKIVELICVEGDSMPSPESRKDGSVVAVLPLLCLYTRHDVFLLKIGYVNDGAFEKDQIQGEVLEMIQPFRGELYPSSVVLRVRTAPHRRLGYAPFQHPGSLAALVSMDSGEQSLLLYHAKSRHVTNPITFPAPEAVFGEPEFTDFSFCQSNALALLVSLSIYVVKSNGEVWGASPILFDGCTVVRALHEQACSLLEDYARPNDEVMLRQCRAGKYFLKEAFVEQAGDYMSAVLLGGNPNRSTLWPAALQGPLLRGGASSSVLTLEPYGASNLVGFVIAGAAGVQICVSPPTMLLPRFAYERGVERPPCIKVVEHIPNLSCTALVRDPVLDTMIHCVSDRGVTTLTSNSLRHFSSSLEGNALSPVPPTKAWMAVDLTKDVHVHGAVVSGDAHLGHVMVVYLSTGHLTAINLTEARVRFEELLQNSQVKTAKTKDVALATMEATPAFHEQLGLVVDKIEEGLLGMSKLVGSATHPQDLDAGLLAAALSVRQRCENDLIKHLRYLRRMTSIRKSEIRNGIKLQATQLQAIQESLTTAKSKRNDIRKKLEQYEEKSVQLANRCSAVLQASKDLRPSLTQADIQYFASLNRMVAQLKLWETKVEQLSLMAESIGSKSSYDLVDLDPWEERNIRTLLHGQMDLIAQAKSKVQTSKDLLEELERQTGISVGGELN